MVAVLTCVMLAQELGKVPVRLLLLKTTKVSCSTERNMDHLCKQPTGACVLVSVDTICLIVIAGDSTSGTNAGVEPSMQRHIWSCVDWDSLL